MICPVELSLNRHLKEEDMKEARQEKLAELAELIVTDHVKLKGALWSISDVLEHIYYWGAEFTFDRLLSELMLDISMDSYTDLKGFLIGRAMVLIENNGLLDEYMEGE